MHGRYVHAMRVLLLSLAAVVLLQGPALASGWTVKHRLVRVPLSRLVPGLNLQGALTLDLQLSVPSNELTQAQGRLEARCHACQIRHRSITLGSVKVPLPHLRLGDVQTRVAIKGGVATIQQLRTRSPDLDLKLFRGHLRLKENPWRSRLDLALGVRLKPALKRRNSLYLLLEASLARNRDPDGYIRLMVKGPLNALRVQLPSTRVHKSIPPRSHSHPTPAPGRATRPRTTTEKRGGEKAKVTRPAESIQTTLKRLRGRIKRRGVRSYRVPRALVPLIEDHGAQMLDGAHALPWYVPGYGLAFRVAKVKPGSLLSALGLVSDDVVIAVNKHRLGSPTEALAAYAALKQAKKLTLLLVRGGKEHTYAYQLY